MTSEDTVLREASQHSHTAALTRINIAAKDTQKVAEERRRKRTSAQRAQQTRREERLKHTPTTDTKWSAKETPQTTLSSNTQYTYNMPLKTALQRRTRAAKQRRCSQHNQESLSTQEAETAHSHSSFSEQQRHLDLYSCRAEETAPHVLRLSRNSNQR